MHYSHCANMNISACLACSHSLLCHSGLLSSLERKKAGNRDMPEKKTLWLLAILNGSYLTCSFDKEAKRRAKADICMFQVTKLSELVQHGDRCTDITRPGVGLGGLCLHFCCLTPCDEDQKTQQEMPLSNKKGLPGNKAASVSKLVLHSTRFRY